jgi:carbamoyl-phosphate synthase large subunit
LPPKIRDRVTVLFTSVGRRVELLRAFGRAFSVLGITGEIVGLDVDALAPALQISDKAYVVPPVSAPEYVRTVEAICRRERVDLVFPLIDPDIPTLAHARSILEATGARVAVMSQEAVAVSGDKWATRHVVRRIGVPTPVSWLPDEMEPATARYPLFVKPRNGSAGKEAFRVNSPRELEFFLQYIDRPIVQEFIDGPEITTDVVCDLEGEVMGMVSRRRIEVRSGEVAKGVTVCLPAVLDGCLRIARALPAIGPITVQCLMQGDTPRFTEINARFGGGVPLGIAAGVNTPLLLLGKCAGIPVPTPPLGLYQTGLYISRFDDSFMMTDDERLLLASRTIEMISSSPA